MWLVLTRLLEDYMRLRSWEGRMTTGEETTLGIRERPRGEDTRCDMLQVW